MGVSLQEFESVIREVFSRVITRAHESGMTEWVARIQDAATAWEGMLVTHETIHPLRLAIDAVIIELGCGPRGALLEQLIRFAHTAGLPDIPLLDASMSPAEMSRVLCLMPEPAVRRTIAINIVLHGGMDEDLVAATAASLLTCPGVWPEISRRPEHGTTSLLVVTELLATFNAVGVEPTSEVVNRWQRIHGILNRQRFMLDLFYGNSKKKKRKSGRTPDAPVPAPDVGDAAKPEVAPTTMHFLDLAALMNFAKSAMEVVSEVRKVTG